MIMNYFVEKPFYKLDMEGANFRMLQTIGCTIYTHFKLLAASTLALLVCSIISEVHQNGPFIWSHESNVNRLALKH